jgi:ABC-type antimicrobial peptide transport system permease subunit
MDTMLRNYLKIAWRNLIKNKTQTFINVVGLSLGMAVVMLISLWVYDEVTWDRSFSNYDRIVQVMQHQTLNGEVGTQNNMPMPAAPKLKEEYMNNFTYVVRATYNYDHIIGTEEKKLTQSGSFMDPEATDLFSLNMIKGSRNGLKDMSSIMLSQSLAKALFGNDDPMGHIVKIDGKFPVKVTGIYADLPRNSSFHDMEFLSTWSLYMTTESWLKNNINHWGNNSWLVYAQLAPGADVNSVSAKIKDIKLRGVILEGDKTAQTFYPQVFLYPMSRWHLYSEFKNGVVSGGQIEYVWLLGMIGLFVLILACINFMNLSTARSEKRAKEVGIRKTLGSVRQQLIGQFFTESVLVAVCSFVLALALVQLAMPWFNMVADKQMNVLWNNAWFWLLGLGFTLLTGVIAGSYPAFYLSSFKPVKVLKGTFKAGRFAAIPRKVLVVLQFTVSVVLIIGTIVVFRQVQYSKDRPVGYTRAGLIQVSLATPSIHNHFAAIKTDLQQTGAIADMAESGSSVTEIGSYYSDFTWDGKDPNLQTNFGIINVSPEYGKVIGWKILAGRDFSKDFATDSLAVIVNEAAVKFMNMKNPVGKVMREDHAYHIIGVVKDMVMTSPYEPINPTLFFEANEATSNLSIRLNPNMGAHEAISKIAPIFNRYDPESPFNYKFTDTEYAHKFANEERFGKLAGFFTILAIFISCLGLFGMASFMAEQRTKEIGVRKVLGATVLNLWQLMSTDFVVLVSISILIAMPVAYYFMNNWLKSYKYNAGISWWIFAITAAGSILITLLTVSYQSIKSAMANPVKSLRSE